MGRVPPNKLYGYRTHATITDAALWYRVNRATGIDLVAGGLVLIVAGYLLPLHSPVETGLLVLIVALMVAHGAYLVRAHRSATGRNETT